VPSGAYICWCAGRDWSSSQLLTTAEKYTLDFAPGQSEFLPLWGRSYLATAMWGGRSGSRGGILSISRQAWLSTTRGAEALCLAERDTQGVPSQECSSRIRYFPAVVCLMHCSKWGDWQFRCPITEAIPHVGRVHRALASVQRRGVTM
jgi:hypothetical protein